MDHLSDTDLFTAYRQASPHDQQRLANEIHRRYGVAFELWLIRAQARWRAKSGTDRQLESIGTSVWRQFFQRLATGYEPHNPGALLQRIAEDEFNERWRQAHRGINKMLVAETPDVADDDEPQTRLELTLDVLALVERLALESLNRQLLEDYSHGLSYAQMAQKHLLSEEAARSRVRRTLQELRHAAQETL